jgi:PKD repeat protein
MKTNAFHAYALTATALFNLPINCSTHLTAQNLFHTWLDESCTPFTPLHPEGIVNNALTYAWNYGDGFTSQAKNPLYAYKTAGSYSLALTITTLATDRLTTELNVTAIPMTWRDGGITDLIPDLYFKVKDQNGALLYDSPARKQASLPVRFLHAVLLKPNISYTIEIWDWDALDTDDYLGSVSIGSNAASGTFSANGISLNFNTTTGKTSYSFSKTVRATTANPTNLSFADGLLTAQSNPVLPAAPTGSYIWKRDGIVIANQSGATYRPAMNGVYTVEAKNGLCISVSNPVTVSRVAVTDLDPEKRWRMTPNPIEVGQKINLTTFSNKTHIVQIAIFDLAGRLIQSEQTQLQIGEHYYQIAPPQYAGLFLVKISAGEAGEKTMKIIVR